MYMSVSVCVSMVKNSCLLNRLGAKCNTRCGCYNLVSIFSRRLNYLAYHPHDCNDYVFLPYKLSKSSLITY